MTKMNKSISQPEVEQLTAREFCERLPTRDSPQETSSKRLRLPARDCPRKTHRKRSPTRDSLGEALHKRLPARDSPREPIKISTSSRSQSNSNKNLQVQFPSTSGTIQFQTKNLSLASLEHASFSYHQTNKENDVKFMHQSL